MAAQTVQIEGRRITISERAGRFRAVLGNSTFADAWGLAHQSPIAVHGSSIQEIRERAATCIANNPALKPRKEVKQRSAKQIGARRDTG
jgi:hypothetical protein